jgi:hypothetical protein
MATVNGLTEIRSADEVRFRKFTAFDRRSPIFEVLIGEVIIFDIARRDGDDFTSDFELGFHDGIATIRVSVSALDEIIRMGKQMVAKDEAAAED